MNFFILLLAVSLIAHASFVDHDHHFFARRDHSRFAKHLNKRCSGSRRQDLSKGVRSPPAPPKSPLASLKPKPKPLQPVASTSSIKGLLNVKSDCGAIGAIEQVTSNAGPNGSEDWLNCGINDSGWRPPYVRINDLIMEDLNQAMSPSNSPFKTCSPYVSFFYQYGKENGIPPIMLAAFALQESSCKEDTTGGAGEQGLMQLTKDKCGDAPGGNCKDPAFNIRTGAKFFSDTLASHGGSVLEAIGMYNGWKSGMTYGEATAAGSGPCCRCQNNLDYIHQFVNGWLMGKNVYGGEPRIGVYFNLDKCDGS